MAQPLTVALPPGVVLWDSCTIQVTALDPTSGAVDTGVVVSNVSFEVELLVGDIGSLSQEPFMLVLGPAA